MRGIFQSQVNVEIKHACVWADGSDLSGLLVQHVKWLKT